MPILNRINIEVKEPTSLLMGSGLMLTDNQIKDIKLIRFLENVIERNH